MTDTEQNLRSLLAYMGLYLHTVHYRAETLELSVKCHGMELMDGNALMDRVVKFMDYEYPTWKFPKGVSTEERIKSALDHIETGNYAVPASAPRETTDANVRSILCDLLKGSIDRKAMLNALNEMRKVEGRQAVDDALMDAATSLRYALPRPKVYLWDNDLACAVSAFPNSSDEHESNHIEVLEAHRKPVSSTTQSILRNVLEKAGVEVVCE